jgi:nitroreductase
MSAGTQQQARGDDAARLPSSGFDPDHEPAALSEATRALIAGRQNVSPKRLVEPGPSSEQLAALFEMAGAAPDHGLLTPWRFVIVPAPKRALLGEVFALALVDRDPGATLAQIEAAREKAHRAPLLMLAIARLGPAEPDIPSVERLVSLGAAVQNMLLAAHAMSFGSGLTSGQAMDSPRMRSLFALVQGEQPVCFVNIGTVVRPKPPRVRPAAEVFFSTL